MAEMVRDKRSSRLSAWPARLWRRRSWAGLTLLAVLALALALRLHGITWGLPYAFINPDEGTVVPKAFAVARGQLNPMFFYYPSFFFYVLAAVFWVASPFWALFTGELLVRRGAFVVDPGSFYLLARLVVVAFGVAAVYLVYRLGREAYGTLAGLLAAVFLAAEPLHVAYSHLAVTDVPAVTLGLLGLLLLLKGAKGQGRGEGLRWLTLGAVAVGLATSTKYNLGMLVLPATVAALYGGRSRVAGAGLARRRRMVAWARLLVTRVYAPMAFAFLLASPFIVIDLPRFLHDFARQNGIVRRGWLGFENVSNGYWYNFNVNLAGALGLVLLALGIAGIGLALWRRRPLDLMVAPYVLAYFLYVSSWKELADRYMLPIVPLLILLAARLCVALFEMRPSLKRALAPGLAAVAAAAIVLPLSDSIAYNRALSGGDVRQRAKAWVERTIEPGSRIATETLGPPLVRRSQLRYYRDAGLRPASYRVRQLKLPLPGERHDHHSLRWLRRHRVEYVILSSAVYERVLAAAAQYPRLVTFYGALERRADLVKVFRPRAGERGPVIKVYRLAPPSGRDG
jgi:hypothetical protein